MALDTAWPWANDICAHTFVRARTRSYVVIAQIGITMGFLLQIRMSWLRALSKGCRCWCWCCGPGCWCCGLAERGFKTGRRWSGAGAVAGVVSWQSAPVLVSADCAHCGGAVSWLCRLRTLFQPVACQRDVGFCLAIWVYAGVILLVKGVVSRFCADLQG